MTSTGGTANVGTIFSVNTDGAGFTILHSFGSVQFDGTGPQGNLTIGGSTLYGMAPFGGYLWIFQVNTNGASYQPFTTILGYVGHLPEHHSLTLVGSTLYGMTAGDGGSASSYGDGNVFQISTNSASISILHAFGSSDGLAPFGSLVFSGSALYGMTFEGGSNNDGVVFSYALPQPPPPPTPVLQMTGIAVQTNDIQISWSATAGTTNAVQATNGAGDGSYSTNFADISPTIFVTGSGVVGTNYVDAGGATNTSTSSRYYRVRLVP